MRLLSLRKTLARVLDQAEICCINQAEKLDELIDREEWELLREMYVLDSTPAGAAQQSDAAAADIPSAILEEPLDIEGDSARPASRMSVGENRNKRLSLLSGVSVLDTSFESTPTSPGRGGYKRLSLLGNGMKSLDGMVSPNFDNEASSGRFHTINGPRSGRRDSFQFDDMPKSASSFASAGSGQSGHVRRTSRIGYVHSSDAPSGPNDSATSKRLSYASSSAASGNSMALNAWGPLGAQRGPSPNLTIGQLTPSAEMQISRGASPSPLGRSSPAFGSTPMIGGVSVSRGASQRSSVMLPIASEGAAPAVDPLSIAGLQNRHEQIHSCRRKMLVRMLALRFDADASYWRTVGDIMKKTQSSFAGFSSEVSEGVKQEMDLGTAKEGTTLKPPSHAKAGGLEGHLGLEDRLQAMALVLRSLQLKMQACAQDLKVKDPPPMHGFEAAEGERPSNARSLATAGAQAQWVWGNTESMFESIREDLLSLSAEWEAGLNIFVKERKRSASPKPPIIPSSSSSPPTASGSREFQSPQEADEDALRSRPTSGRPTSAELRSRASVAQFLSDNAELDDSEIADLVRQSTDPKHLPPPGLEQIFESIAGLAGSVDKTGDYAGLSREERIAKVKEQRANKLTQQADSNRNSTASLTDSGMMSELKDVIAQIKQKRGISAAEEQTKLGSPFDLGDSAPSQTGRFAQLSSSASYPAMSNNRPDFESTRARLRAPSSASDSQGKTDRRQSTALNGVVSGMGSNHYGVWDPSATPHAGDLSRVSETGEETTPTAPYSSLYEGGGVGVSTAKAAATRAAAAAAARAGNSGAFMAVGSAF